jgi:hypothetical protein
MKIEVESAGHKMDYSKRTELFDEQRLSFIESVAPTPWKVKTNYSSYTIFDAEGKKIATLPDGTKDTNVSGNYTRDLLVATPQLLAEVLRLREAIADIATNMEAADESYMGGFIEDLRKVIE